MKEALRIRTLFNTIASVNKAVINQLRQALKRIEEKMSAIIAAEDELNQQYKLLTSIAGHANGYLPDHCNQAGYKHQT